METVYHATVASESFKEPVSPDLQLIILSIPIVTSFKITFASSARSDSTLIQLESVPKPTQAAKPLIKSTELVRVVILDSP